ncbi:hypothetical protein MUP79_07380 [Candidatus Bathyarchaeota archaeon]|nr:hypothetical protein [Candidatus Bathyarchaeota archaeon]
MMRKAFAELVYEPSFYRLYGRFDGQKFYRFLRSAQWNPLDKNREIQRGMLFTIIDYAANNIPYYQRIVKEKGLTYSRDTIYDDLRKFPVLTKEIIRREFANLCKVRRERWYYETSGGSTGEPMRLVQDFEFKMKLLLVKRWQKEWAGVHVGEPEIKLWGSERDILQGTVPLKNRLDNYFRNVTLLNAFRLDDARVMEYINVINRRRPKLIVAYVQSIYELARFVEQNKLAVYTPKAIMTTAGVLYPAFRERIESVFKCKTFDRYGSREVGDISCECDRHEGHHIAMFNMHVEILDKNMMPCKEGEAGEVYITLLTNYTMPLLRYRIGDIAAYTAHRCSCRRGIPLIKSIVGRTNCILRTKKTVLDSTALTTSFYFLDSIVKYQLIQKKLDQISIKVVVSDLELWKKDKAMLDHKLRKILGEDVKYKYEVVDDISPSPSGKYQYIMSELEE